MERSHGLDEEAEAFHSTGCVLIEKLASPMSNYQVSYLDFNCVILKLGQCQGKYAFHAYSVDSPPPDQQDFCELVTLRSKVDSQAYLLSNNGCIVLAKSASRSGGGGV